MLVMCKVRVSELLVLPINSVLCRPREFFSRQVRVCVLHVSCVFCLLSFTVCCSCSFVLYVLVLLGSIFGRCFGENFANCVEVLCWVCCSVGFRVQVGWFHWKQYPLVMVRAGICRSRFRLVLPLVLGDILANTLPISWESGVGFVVLWIF